MRSIAYALFYLVFLLSNAAAKFQQFPEHEFSIVIPDGFTELTGQTLPPDTLAVYANGDLTDGKPHAVISLQMLNGTIGKDSHLRDSDLPHNIPGAVFSLGRIDWKRHSLDRVDGAVTQGGVQMASVVVQIPLAPKALQVNMAAPVEQKSAMEANASRLVASVIGPSNWEGPVMRKLSTAERVQKLIIGTAQMAAVCALALFLYRRIRRPNPAKSQPDA